MSEPRGGPSRGQQRWSVGDVEQEAEQLVAAARRWLQSVPMSARSGPPGERAADPWADLTDRVGEQPPRAADPGAGGPTAAPDQEHRCTGCPWCRARTAMGPVGAETLDSLADLLTSASESLRAFAEHRRERAHGEAADTTTDEADVSNEPAAAGQDVDAGDGAEPAADRGAQR